MHMADALLSPAVGAAGYGISGGLLARAARRVAGDRDYERQVPLMGVLGAFIFAAQMINFSIPGTGSSGHIGGGLLLSILLGPWPAFLVIASVLTVQCFFFLDGGLLALGCNTFNLGFWPAFLGLPLYRWIRGRSRSPLRETLAVVTACVVALELGAFGVVAETLLSGRTDIPPGGFLALMLGIHFPIALGEGLLTGMVVAWARRFFADRVTPLSDQPAGSGFKPLLVAFGLLALLTAGVLAWFASANPDGLEWSLQKVTGALEPEGVSSSKLEISMGGLKGAALTALLIGALGWGLHRLRPRPGKNQIV
ncbi:MAG: energy-coupling factor ABC transporter permease [Kiritimatiellia bacterium]